MKYRKMLGLAAMAAALTILVGAGAASVTKLCENTLTGACTNVVAFVVVSAS